jgi:hypothetical protein
MKRVDNTFEDAYIQTLINGDDEPTVSVSAEMEPTETITKKVCILTDSAELLDLIDKDILNITINVKGDDENVTTVEIPTESLQVISVEDFEPEEDFEEDEKEVAEDEESDDDDDVDDDNADDDDDLIAEDEEIDELEID